MSWRILAGCLWVGLLSTPGLAAPTVALLDDQPRTFQLGSGYTTDFYFDVPEGTQQIKLDLNGLATSADLDLMLRYGKPFPDGVADFFQLQEYAHYHSISGTAQESIVVSPTSARPPKAGRWYVVALNGSAAAVNARLGVDFQLATAKAAQISVRFDLPCPEGFETCNCDASFWNATAVGPAAPGNRGVNLGEKRRNAFQEAVRILSSRLTSEVPIVVQACWSDLGAEDDRGVALASASPSYFLINDPTMPDEDDAGRPLLFTLKQLPESHTYYSAAAATRLGGTDACRLVSETCGSDPSIFIHFNTQIDGPGALGSAGFYYGLTGSTGRDADFITVALHELTHGFGFSSLVDLDAGSLGQKRNDRDDIFSRQISDARTVPARSFTAIADAERGTAVRSLVNLQWTAPETLATATAAKLDSDIGFRMYAPIDIEPGSTLSHVDLRFSNELMEPQLGGIIRTLGLAEPMLHAVGWSKTARVFPATQPIFTGLYFDPQRPGHGVDFQPVSGSPYDNAVALFYSYDGNGQPEYFIAVGPMVDGVFTPLPNENGDSLVRYVIVNGVPVADTSSKGFMRMDFNDPGRSAACQRPGVSIDTTSRRAAMVVVINGITSDWCLQPLITSVERESPDRTGIWVNGGSNDPGWGLTLAPLIRSNGSSAFFGILYYHDGNGQPRWAFSSAENFSAPTTLALNNIRGYCRTCSDNGRPSTVVGQMQLDLRAPLTGNSAGVQISFPGTPAASFQRASTPLSRLSAPPRLLDGS